MDGSVSGRSVHSAAAGAHHDSCDGDATSEHSSFGHVSRLQRCFQFSRRTRDLFSDWKSLFWKRRPVKVLLWANTLVFAAVVCSEILIFETSTPEVRRHRHRTSIFPLYIPVAAALAASCKWEGSVAWANFLGFVVGRVYVAARDGYSIVDEKIFYIVILSLLGMLEVQVAAHLVRIKLCHSLKPVPFIDTVRDAMWYFGIVFVVSLFFETLMAVVNCTTGLLAWSQFPRFWSTWWMAVLAALLTVTPAFIHFLEYRPRYNKLLRPSKILECILLVACTICVLGLIIFSVPFTTVIRPLPYLLYPLLIFSVFRFNRLGWAVVVACVSYFCSWGTLHFESSALFIISGIPDRSSPEVILQIELFMSILGLVSISLAAAVREKKQLTKDLHNMNQKLEDAVRKRTQELMKANSELQVSQANAEKANHAKSDFLASMSHEIRTPIHGILGLTDLLIQSQLSPDQLESMASVKDCADLLLHVINSILDLAKIEAGRLEIECVPFKIRDIVSTALRMFQDRANERGILLLWKVDANVPPLVIGDPGKLQQCLLNLVGNALKFTHQGSVIVTVRLFHSTSETAVPHTTPLQSRMLEEPSRLSTLSRLRTWASWPSSDIKVEVDSEAGHVIELQHKTNLEDSNPIYTETSDTAMVLATDSLSHSSGLLETEKLILFEVRDTGIGISEEIVQEMFNPFTQADASTSRLYGGTGLGLCIVQRFLELLKGRIWVESEIGKGSTFCFIVPLQPLADETVGGSRRQYYHAVLEPSPKTLNLTLPSINKEAAAHHFSQGCHIGYGVEEVGTATSTVGGARRRIRTCRSLDSSSFRDKVSGDQEDQSICKQSVGLVDRKKRTMEGREEPGLDTTTNESSRVERQRKLQKGAASLITSTKIVGRKPNSSAGDDYHIPLLLDCNRNVDVTINLDAGEQSDNSDNEGRMIGCNRELSSFKTKFRDTPKVESAGWDLEQGLVETRNPKPKLVERFTGCNESHPSREVMLGNIESSPKVDSTSRVQSAEMFKLLPRKENLHILLAEDNLINQKVASRQLVRYGHTVTIVGDGLQALEVLRRDRDKFDLVLMDIQMPNLDGLRATSIFREEEAIHGWRRLPILGLTAHAISGYQDTCFSHGMDAYLGKPFQIQDLLQADSEETLVALGDEEETNG